jgi:hypothetical protein
MDRTLIKEALTDLGVTDNTVGLMLHDRPYDGRFEYAFGIFDNLSFEKVGLAGLRESDQLMPCGRFVCNLLDPATPRDGYADYMESYIGKGDRLALGVNAASLGGIRNGLSRYDLYAWGTDLFFNTGPFTFTTEYDWFQQDAISAVPDIEGDGWYVQAGYLLHYCDYLACPCDCVCELAVRYQELDPNEEILTDRLRWTSLGMNIYMREHNLKVQMDYTFRAEEVVEINNDLVQVQLQLDY